MKLTFRWLLAHIGMATATHCVTIVVRFDHDTVGRWVVGLTYPPVHGGHCLSVSPRPLAVIVWGHGVLASVGVLHAYVQFL